MLARASLSIVNSTVMASVQNINGLTRYQADR